MKKLMLFILFFSAVGVIRPALYWRPPSLFNVLQAAEPVTNEKATLQPHAN